MSFFFLNRRTIARLLPSHLWQLSSYLWTIAGLLTSHFWSSTQHLATLELPLCHLNHRQATFGSPLSYHGPSPSHHRQCRTTTRPPPNHRQITTKQLSAIAKPSSDHRWAFAKLLPELKLLGFFYNYFILKNLCCE